MKAKTRLRLGVNIDHVATIRNARGGAYPDPVEAALSAIDAGADGITAHLREDRRHIRDDDIARLKAAITRPLNLEMAATEEMVKIAIGNAPHAACIVPEKREELTTEGGLEVAGDRARIGGVVEALKAAGIRVSLFIEPDPAQIEAAAMVGADVVELHTGTYCHAAEAGGADGAACRAELARLAKGAGHAASLGLEPHAGHGLGFDTVAAVAAIPELTELNIGHFLIGASVLHGLGDACKKMRRLMDGARA